MSAFWRKKAYFLNVMSILYHSERIEVLCIEVAYLFLNAPIYFENLWTEIYSYIIKISDLVILSARLTDAGNFQVIKM